MMLTRNLSIMLIISLLSSCEQKRTTPVKTSDQPTGSTLDNINNSEYTTVQFTIDNREYFATINQYFENYQYKHSFPLVLWVTVETLDKNEMGFPTDKEALLYNSFEDSLISDFIQKIRFCYIGRTIRDGYRELIFYVADKSEATEAINAFIQKNAGLKRNVEFTIENDPEWESVGGLYP